MVGVSVTGAVVTPVTLCFYSASEEIVRHLPRGGKKHTRKTFAMIRLDGAFVCSSIDELRQAASYPAAHQNCFLPCPFQGLDRTD
jgi:hypothetical protein